MEKISDLVSKLPALKVGFTPTYKPNRKNYYKSTLHANPQELVDLHANK